MPSTVNNQEVAARVLQRLSQYASYDPQSRTVNLDLASFINNVQPYLATIRAAFTSAVASTYQGAETFTLNSNEELAAAANVVAAPFNNLLQNLAGVDAAELFGDASAVGKLLVYYIGQWRAQENYDPVGALLERINNLASASSVEQIIDNVNQALILPFIASRGIQTTVDQFSNVIGNGNIDLSKGLVLIPALTTILSPSALEKINGIVNIITNQIKSQILNTGNDAEPNHFYVAVNGNRFDLTDAAISVFITDVDALGTNSIAPLDASKDTVSATRFLLAGNLDGSNGESLIGSQGSDIFFVGADDSVNTGGGNDIIIFEDGISTVEAGIITDPSSGFQYATVTSSFYHDYHNRQVVDLPADGFSTLIGFEGGHSIDNESLGDDAQVDMFRAENIDRVTVNFINGGLLIGEGYGTLLAPALSDNFGGSVDTRMFNSTVQADFIVNNEPFTAVNSGNSIQADTNVSHFFLNDDATLIAGSEFVTVNGISYDSDVFDAKTIVGAAPQHDYERARLNAIVNIQGRDFVVPNFAVKNDAFIDSLTANGETISFDGNATINNFTGNAMLNVLSFNTDGNVHIECSSQQRL